MSRVKTYGSVAELRADSDLVIVGKGTGELREGKGSAQYVPFADTPVEVTQVIDARGTQVGDRVWIGVEANLADGKLSQDKIVAGRTYLLFLNKVWPGDPTDDSYAVVGYRAGVYEQVAPGKFGRVDGESTHLPVGLDARQSGELVEVETP